MKFLNAQVFDTDRGEFVQEDFFVKDKKFASLQEMTEDSREIDLGGCYVTPGLIDAHSHLGMWEENLGVEGEDGNEITDPVTPNLRSIDGINPMDVAFEKALKGGVTTVSSGPGSANVLGGQFAILKTFGRSVDEMVIRESSSMKCAFGENPKRCYGSHGKAPMTRMAIAALLRETLEGARDYMRRRDEASNYSGRPAYDCKMEAMIPVIKGELPLKVHAHRADDILTAIRIIKEFDLKASLDHCTEGHLISDYIKDSGLPVVVGPTFGFNTKVELCNKTFDTPKKLYEAGIPFAIMTDHPVHPQSSLIFWAILSHKAGLPKGEALRAITISPAEILGIDDKVGSIKEGRDADFVVWDRDPMDIYARVVGVWIDGVNVYTEEDHHFLERLGI
ncbi:MAG: amidohydrolase family protein [Filifactor alocis]|nr:amidohydrolase family protein [Filifactor alocis]